jgi:hypothetical protein
LDLYRALNTGEYVGGMEYTALMRRITKALNPQESEIRWRARSPFR